MDSSWPRLPTGHWVEGERVENGCFWNSSVSLGNILTQSAKNGSNTRGIGAWETKMSDVADAHAKGTALLLGLFPEGLLQLELLRVSIAHSAVTEATRRGHFHNLVKKAEVSYVFATG